MVELQVRPQLALFGAQPAFNHPLHVGQPNIGDRNALFERINDALDRRWLSNDGPYVQELEQRIADFVGVSHCVTTCNGTVALELLIRALELEGEVIVPSFTFVATAHALQWHGITPIFCDVDPQTHNIDPHEVVGRITPRTSAILGVHVWGRPCDWETLTKIGEEHDLKLIFDAAHAFGCSSRGRMVGNFGEAEVFSFHATKAFHTFEGGAIVTNDDTLAEKVSLMRSLGLSADRSAVSIGINAKMNEISAAMGLTLLEDIDELYELNYENYRLYREQLEDVPGVYVVPYDESKRCNYQYVVLEIDETITGVSRDELVKVLREENVLARRYFHPGCHRLEPYRSLYPDAGDWLPETEALTERVLVLPNGSAVGPPDVQKISGRIRAAVAHGALVHEWIDSRGLLSTPAGLRQLAGNARVGANGPGAT